MAVISSRPDDQEDFDEHIETLQGIVTECSGGAIGPDGSGALYVVGDNLEDLIDQTEAILHTYERTVEIQQLQVGMLTAELIMMSHQAEVAQDALANLIGNIDYDEAMDHATADLIDCIASHGTADVNADGKLVFAERTLLSKEDLKPMLREAIVRWVEQKMSQ
jgi:hypothetical protein